MERPDCKGCKHEPSGVYTSPRFYCGRVRRTDKWEPIEPITETWYILDNEEHYVPSCSRDVFYRFTYQCIEVTPIE